MCLERNVKVYQLKKLLAICKRQRKVGPDHAFLIACYFQATNKILNQF
jgi:hypothetical protein